MSQNQIDPDPDPTVVAKWAAFLTSAVLLIVGIASLFSLNIDKDALLALVPSAAFVAAALVTVVHSFSSHKLQATRVNAQVRLLEVNQHYDVERSNVRVAVAPSDLTKLKDTIVSEVKELLDRAHDLTTNVLVAGEHVAHIAGEDGASILDSMHRLEEHLTSGSSGSPAAPAPAPAATPVEELTPVLPAEPAVPTGPVVEVPTASVS